MARDLDKIADVLPTVVTKKRKPITPFILDLIKKKSQLRRQKTWLILTLDVCKKYSVK